MVKKEKPYRPSYAAHLIDLAIEIKKKLKENDIFLKERLQQTQDIKQQWEQFVEIVLKKEEANRKFVLGGKHPVNRINEDTSEKSSNSDDE